MTFCIHHLITDIEVKSRNGSQYGEREEEYSKDGERKKAGYKNILLSPHSRKQGLILPSTLMTLQKVYSLSRKLLLTVVLAIGFSPGWQAPEGGCKG